jgi:hypothetical protein
LVQGLVKEVVLFVAILVRILLKNVDIFVLSRLLLII